MIQCTTILENYVIKLMVLFADHTGRSKHKKVSYTCNNHKTCSLQGTERKPELFKIYCTHWLITKSEEQVRRLLSRALNESQFNEVPDPYQLFPYIASETLAKERANHQDWFEWNIWSLFFKDADRKTLADALDWVAGLCLACKGCLIRALIQILRSWENCGNKSVVLFTLPLISCTVNWDSKDHVYRAEKGALLNPIQV